MPPLFVKIASRKTSVCVNSYRIETLTHRALSHFIQYRDQFINFFRLKNSINAARTKISVRRIVKQTRIHRTVFGQMIND